MRLVGQVVEMGLDAYRNFQKAEKKSIRELHRDIPAGLRPLIRRVSAP